MTIINPGFNALNAYNRAAGAGALGAGGSEPDNKTLGALGGIGGAGQSPSFGDFLTTATSKAIETQKVSEKASADAVLGKADMTDVIQAVNNAEMSLNMFLSIRDKLVDAYQRISQTQI
jgi:flagellar hook-basal body complex protein FliE